MKSEIEEKACGNYRVVQVQNADGERDTTAQIIVQNEINYEPKVSVIIPVYNVEKYLSKCLDTILNQTLNEIEVICVDDGSTDNSLRILKEYAQRDRRVTVVSRENKGVGYSRNEGMKLATGEFVAFMDPDDYYPDASVLEVMYSKAVEHNVKICGGSLIVYDENRKVEIRKQEKNECFTEDEVRSYSDFQYDFGFQRYIYNRKLLEQNKIIFPHYARFQDPPFMIKAFVSAGTFYALKLYTYAYRWAHKTLNWTEEKVCHLLKGLRDDLLMARDSYLEDLFSLTLSRIQTKYKQELNLYNTGEIRSLKEEIMSICLQFARNKYADGSEKPKVSVILPIYNAEQYLKECLNSIINQTFKEIEIICVNDGSTDNSLDIIKKYAQRDGRIKYINKPNAGYGQTMNCGLDLATGEYIGIVEPDDYIETTMYEILYKRAKETNVDFVKGDVYFWYSKTNKRTYSNIITNKNLYNEVQYDLSNTGLMVGAIANCAGIYRTEFLEQHHIRYHESPGASFQDQGFYYQVMFHAHSGLFLNIPLYHYRQDNQASSVNDLSKVFCIFDEYKFVHECLAKVPYKERFYPLLYRKMINSYLWNLSRIGTDLAPDFKVKICEHFNIAVKNRELTREVVGNEFWKRILPFLNIEDSHTIPIILSSSKQYAPLLYVTMFSVLMNAKINTHYEFYLLIQSGFSLRNTEKISGLEQAFNCSIHFVDMKNAFSDLEQPIAHVATPTYYKLLAANILPKGYSKCIYLDVDVCVCTDLSDLIDTDIKGYYLAGVVAPGYYFNEEYHCPRLGLDSMRNYINAGVLLMNLEEIRRDNVTQKFVKLSQKNYETVDQDVINVACYNKIKLLPLKYNVMPERIREYSSELKELFSEEEIEEAKNNPSIIHYVDKVKPWDACEIFMADYWWKYAAKTGLFRDYRKYLKQWYTSVMRKPLNLDKTQTFNEKIQWLKLYDSTLIKTRLADKYLVREWVKEKIGEQYLIPLLGVYDRFEDINFSQLPDQFVIKCNHGCGYNIIVKDKSQLDRAEAKLKVDRWMRENYAFKWGFELYYRDIKPKILIEQCVTNDGQNLYDYKFWCFNGEVKYVQFRDDFPDTLKMVFYDLNWKRQPFYYNHSTYEEELAKPDNFDEMVQIAKMCCQSFPFVCVDLYRLNDGTIKFGEMTFTCSSGVVCWNNEKYNLMLGKLIKLPPLAYDIDTCGYYKPKRDKKTRPYLHLFLNWYRKHRLQEQSKLLCTNHIQNQLRQLRVDIKNIGTEHNAILIEAEGSKITVPKWFTNAQGVGQVLTSYAGKGKIRIFTANEGKLTIIFRGPDRRFEGKRFPLWNDYKSIRIDGKEVLSSPIAVWHNKPWRYEMPVRDKQEVWVEYEQQTHSYSREELKETILKLNPTSDVIQENIDALTDEIKNDKSFKISYRMGGERISVMNANNDYLNDILKQLQQMRIDIKNFGAKENKVSIQAENSTITTPGWFKNAQGEGCSLAGYENRGQVKIRAINDGRLELKFMGPDKRFEGVRFPVWSDYKSIKIGGAEVLSSPVAVWHDEAWLYKMPVKDGQEILIEYERQAHPYSREDLKETILRLNPTWDAIQENIDALTDEIYKIISQANAPLNEKQT